MSDGNDSALTLVNERFDEARDYANSAFVTANAFLIEMRNAAAQITAIANPTNITLEDVDISAAEMRDIGAFPLDPTIELNTVDAPDRPAAPTFKDIPEILVALTTEIETKLATRLTDGALGISATTWQAIYDRAKSRQELENLKKYEEAEKYYSSRGTSLPPGALSGKLNELLVEFARNDSYLNNDIMIQEAKMLVDNENTMLEAGTKYILQRLTENATVVIEENKMKLQLYLGQFEAYKGYMETEIARIEALVKIYVSQLEVCKTKAQVEGVRIDALVKSLELALRKVIASADVEVKEATINSENIKNAVALDIELIKGGAQIAAQLAASAMSSVNASASLGASDTVSSSHQYEENRAVPTTSYNYNASV
jgi:hypothetical protein